MKKTRITHLSPFKGVLFTFMLLLSVTSVVAYCLGSSDDEKLVYVQQDPDPTQNPSGTLTAHEMTAEMAAGFNLGNAFDLGIQSPTLAHSQAKIDLYANAGMKNVRIPVTWIDGFNGDHLADTSGNLNTNHTRFKELVKVIDYALEKDLYVIINAHHEHWLNDHYDGSSSFDNRFAKLWTDIATYFKDYSQKLVFETLNEPQGYFGEWDGSGPFPDPTSSTALNRTRHINEVAYDAIRATGGNNETRFVMVSVNALGNEDMIQEVYPNKNSLPGNGNDDYVGIQVHSYNPWSFCGQDGRNTNYPGNTSIENAIKVVGTHAKLLDVPVCYGEFGVGREGSVTSPNSERNTDLVRGYYKTFHDTTLAKNMSYNVWDDRGWFGLVNSSGTSFIYNIVPFMMQ